LDACTAESGRRPLPGKLSLNGGLVDDRPNRFDFGEFERVKDVLRKRDPAPVDAQPKELPLWGAFEGEAGRDVRRRAGQKLDVEAQVGDILEVLHEHVTVTGQLERSAVMLDFVIDVLPEFVPVLSVQAVDVGSIDIRKSKRSPAQARDWVLTLTDPRPDRPDEAGDQVRIPR